MSHEHPFLALSPTTVADQLSRDHVMDVGIRPLWEGMPRVAGRAFTVQCAAGDNLMLHAAIYRAPVGSILVVDGVDTRFAVAGGNVCAVAMRRGIQALVVDGVIRDLAEVRRAGFPVFARGVCPIPGGKSAVAALDGTVRCGGVTVTGGDVVVADEEGIVVVPQQRQAAVLDAARARAARDAADTLDVWEAAHRAKIEEALRKHGYPL